MLSPVTFPGFSRLLMLLLVLVSFPATALAQSGQPGPEELADRAVTQWRERTAPDFETLTAMGTVELCEAIPALLVNPPPPAGTRVNLDDRLELPTDDPDRRLYSYSAVGPADQLAVVQVELQLSGDNWQVSRVGFRQAPPGGIRAWVQTPAAAWTFSLLSLAVLVVLLVPGSWLKRLLARAFAVIREHRRTYTVSLVLLFGLFAAGVFTGSQLPEECSAAIMDTVSTAVSGVGATEAYLSGNIPRAATVTFHQNFVVVTASTLFSLALLFGIPAYLFGGFSFFAQAIPFGLIEPAGLELLLIGILLLLELFAYFSVIAGGGILLVTLFRKGFQALPEAVGKLLLMVPLAGLLLLIGAWYEAFIIIGVG